jgi:hypothetical protein
MHACLEMQRKGHHSDLSARAGCLVCQRHTHAYRHTLDSVGAPNRTGRSTATMHTEHRQPSRRDGPTVATYSACAAGSSECGARATGHLMQEIPAESCVRLAGCAFPRSHAEQAHAGHPCMQGVRTDTHIYTRRQTHAAMGNARGEQQQITCGDACGCGCFGSSGRPAHNAVRGEPDAVVLLLFQSHTNTHKHRHHQSSGGEGTLQRHAHMYTHM